jgi:hypothetical protein
MLRLAVVAGRGLGVARTASSSSLPMRRASARSTVCGWVSRSKFSPTSGAWPAAPVGTQRLPFRRAATTQAQRGSLTMVYGCSSALMARRSSMAR